MLVRVDAADRLVQAVHRRGAVRVDEAARILLALVRPPSPVALALVEDVVARDARLVRSEDAVRLAEAPGAMVPLERARFAVVDVETTGFVPGVARISELAGVVVENGAVAKELELTLAGGRSALLAVRRLLAFARGGTLVGHNVRFDIGFLDHELALGGGDRIASPVVDTMVLARRLLRGRTGRVSLAALAEFYGTSSVPCHHALPDARATAEILTRLVDAAVDRGARTVGDLCALARTRVSPVDHLA